MRIVDYRVRDKAIVFAMELYTIHHVYNKILSRNTADMVSTSVLWSFVVFLEIVASFTDISEVTACRILEKPHWPQQTG